MLRAEMLGTVPSPRPHADARLLAIGLVWVVLLPGALSLACAPRPEALASDTTHPPRTVEGAPEAQGESVVPWTAGRDGRTYRFSGIFEAGPADCEERMAFDVTSVRSIARRRLECTFDTQARERSTTWLAHCSGDVNDIGMATVEALTVSNVLTRDAARTETRDANFVSTRVVEDELSVQCVWRGTVSPKGGPLEPGKAL